jgi:hypothetical protein
MPLAPTLLAGLALPARLGAFVRTEPATRALLRRRTLTPGS